MPGHTIQIKRYPNRRFYARHTSKYVSLQEIEELVRQGSNIEVRDSRTGEDMTHAVLTQIIVDRQPDKMSLLPIDMLYAIMRSNDAVAEFLRDYFRQSVTYLDYLQQHTSSPRVMVNPMNWVKAWLGRLQTAENGSQDQLEPTPVQDEALAERVKHLEARLRQVELQQPQNGKS